jgi:hypothetical protein
LTSIRDIPSTSQLRKYRSIVAGVAKGLSRPFAAFPIDT